MEAEIEQSDKEPSQTNETSEDVKINVEHEAGKPLMTPGAEDGPATSSAKDSDLAEKPASDGTVADKQAEQKPENGDELDEDEHQDKANALISEDKTGDDDQAEDDDDEDEDEEDQVKVTIEDTVPDYNLRAKQRQPQQQKQATIDLDAGQSIVDVDLNSLEDKPWRKPGADISDYFNYGFDEDTWKLYCDKQKKMRNEVNQLASASESFKIPVVPANEHSKYSGPMKIPTIVTADMPRFNAWQVPIVPDPDADIERERERERHREREKTRDRDKDRDREKDRDRDKGRDRDKRDREKTRDRDKERERERDKDRGDRHRDPDRDKDRERDKLRDKDRHRHGKKRERDRSRDNGGRRHKHQRTD